MRQHWKIFLIFSLAVMMFYIYFGNRIEIKDIDLRSTDRKVWNIKMMVFREPLNDDYHQWKSNNSLANNNYNGSPTGNPNLYFRKKNSKLPHNNTYTVVKNNKESSFLNSDVILHGEGSQECNKFSAIDPIDLMKRKDLLQIHGIDAFLDTGGTVPNKNIATKILCELHAGFSQQYCKERYISEIVDLVYSFQPIYSTRQTEQGFMYTHHTNFKHYMQSYGFKVITIEGIYPNLNQTFQVTSPGNEPEDIQLHLYDKIYMRENLLNVAARKVKGWEYLLWIDAHQIFLNKYWWEEAIYKMEHYNSVQFFQTLAHQLQDTNETNIFLDFPGTLYIWSHTRPIQIYKERDQLWIGNAFGIRRELYEEIEYIMDYGISGCCDCAYNMASFNNWNDWNIFIFWPLYVDVFKPWVERTRTIFQSKTSYVRGHMIHLWHERFFHFEEMLKAIGQDKKFNPETDMGRDENFTIFLIDQGWKDIFAKNG